MINRFILFSDNSRMRKSGSNGSAKLRVIGSLLTSELRSRLVLRTATQQRFVAFSRLPVDSVLFEVSVHRAAYRRIEVGGTEAIE